MVFRSVYEVLVFLFFKSIYYLNINRIQVEFKKEGYASIWPGITAPERHEKLQVVGFCAITSLNEQIDFKFIWYMTINKIQIEFEKGGYTSVWTVAIATDRSQKWKIYGFCSITLVLMS